MYTGGSIVVCIFETLYYSILKKSVTINDGFLSKVPFLLVCVFKTAQWKKHPQPLIMSEVPLARPVIDHLCPPILSSLGRGGQILVMVSRKFHSTEIIVVTFNEIAGRKILSFTKNVWLKSLQWKDHNSSLTQIFYGATGLCLGAGEVQIWDRGHSDLTDLVRMA